MVKKRKMGKRKKKLNKKCQGSPLEGTRGRIGIKIFIKIKGIENKKGKNWYIFKSRRTR